MIGAHHLLTDLAVELWDTAARWVPVVSDTNSAAAAPSPYGAYVYAQLIQGRKEWDDFQLPEPLLHPIEGPAVLVVGLNPGYGASEVIPTIKWPSSLAIEWYASRFDAEHRDAIKGFPTGRYDEGDKEYVNIIPHYRNVEQLLTPVLGEQSLGKRAVYCDAIPWKFNNPRKADERWMRPQMTPKEWREEWCAASRRVARIANALQPSAVLTLGRETAAKALPLEWRARHVAASHPSRQWPEGAKQCEYARVQEQLLQLLAAP